MINLTQERKAIAQFEKQALELKNNMLKKQLDDKLKDISTFIMKNDKLTETTVLTNARKQNLQSFKKVNIPIKMICANGLRQLWHYRTARTSFIVSLRYMVLKL